MMIANLGYLVVVFIAAYAYAAYFMSKLPDPTTEFGLSLNAAMAGAVGVGASAFAFIVVLATGTIGYFISTAALPWMVYKVVKKLTTENKTPAA